MTKLCTEPMCDRGKVITDEVTEEGKFVLEDCPVCEGKGWVDDGKDKSRM